MRVFLSHASPDKPLVRQLAQALAERGFIVWLDEWEIAPGDDVVSRINQGLETADAGLICFSEHTSDRNWVQAEVSFFTWARIEEGKLVIPVIIGDKPVIPALLRPVARRGIEEIDAIADALQNRRPGPPPGTVALDRVGTSGVKVAVTIGDARYAGAELAELPADLLRGRAEFLKGFRTGLRRSPAEGERAGLETELRQLGHALRKLCLPEDSADALTTLIDGAPVGTLVEVLFQSDDPELLGLPFEALRLADDRLLATVANVVTFRTPATATASLGGSAASAKQPAESLAGPIKVLIAVGAPDEGQTASVVLDHERELQNILNAVETAQKSENFQVRILEVGHPEVIQTALRRDPYHVLHLSCHGGPGELELEDEEGRAVRTTAQELLAALVASGRPVPLIFLNSCHGGVAADTTASFSVDLLRRGVPAVVAMQTSVSDHYATQLAEAFYGQLANHEPPLASRALAAAREQVEQARHKAIQLGASLAETQPEYATAALYLAGTEQPVADLARNRQPLTRPPVYAVSGPVPQLRIDDLIGRRANLRHTLQTLRDTKRPKSGVVLTGLGGVGKSAVAGRVMQRMKEEGWLIAAHGGRFDVRGIAMAVAGALVEARTPARLETAKLLQEEETNDVTRLQVLAQLLATEPLLLVLDDF
ncbi:MAG: CHAT domain-containing protein, partial [Planctomycetota bacterium]|nr:CHAT domain-containing protein [Planctomycetota bacterium]